MTFDSSFPMMPLAIGLILLFAFLGGAFVLSMALGARFDKEKKPGVFIIIPVAIMLLGVSSAIAAPLLIQAQADREAEVQLQEQAQEVYGIDLPDAAVGQLLSTTSRPGSSSLDSYRLDSRQDDELYEDVIRRYGTGEWIEDGQQMSAQLVWDGSQYVLIQSDVEGLVELDRR